MTEQTILIVEDDPDIRDGVRILLAGEGYRILEAENGAKALQTFSPEVDLVILDVMMPGMSGLRVCEELRKRSTVPILFLSARVRALLRRYTVYRGKGEAAAPPERRMLCAHGVKLSLDCNRVWVDGQEVNLTETEYGILRLLMQDPERIYPAQAVYEAVWNEPYYYTSNGTVMVHIRNLRLKIEDDPQNPRRVCTVWGKGYHFARDGGGGHEA